MLFSHHRFDSTAPKKGTPMGRIPICRHPVAVPSECPRLSKAFVPRCPFVVPGRNFACQSRLVSCRPRHTLHLPLTLPLAAGKFVSAATRFVKAQATMLHFPLVENFTCALAFPLPTKQALRGPQVVRHRRRSPHSPESHLRFDSVFIYIQKADTPKGVSAFWCRQPESNRYGFYSEGF